MNNRIRSITSKMRRKCTARRLIVTAIVITIAVLVVIPITGVRGSYASAFSNKQVFDTKNNFNKAWINTFSGRIEVEIKSWDDFEDGVNIQVVTKDGKVYYSAAENIMLISDK